MYKLFVVGMTLITSPLSAKISDNSSPCEFEFTYTGDLVRNFEGGIKTGTTYLGLANLKAHFNTEYAKWWAGGEAFINIGNTHGGKPSATLVGDFQGVSNIEAGNLTFLYELWYKESIGKCDFTIGLQDLNTNFSISENALLFTNSSFGIQSSIADNIPTPIFPLTALGLNFKWNMNSDLVWQAAIFDGTPDDFENNPYNINWKLGRDQGFLLVSEFQIHKSLIRQKTGSYKFGIYYHQHNDSIDVEQKNGGLYFVGDQQITNNFFVFTQIGLSPKTLNMHNHYYSLGLNYKKLISGRPFDECGIAVAYAGIDGNSIGSETAIEITYKYQMNNHIYLRPDLQYIINPAGTTVKLHNALVGFIRVGINY